MTRDDNVKIFSETLDYINSNELLKSSVSNSIKGTKIYLEKDAPKRNISLTKVSNLNNVFVSQNKSFEAAIKILEKNGDAKVGVLNFASASNPGGGVKNGSFAQEESLCRCSTLYPCLTTEELWNKFYYPHRKASNPLHNDDIIYIPDIYICRSDDGLFKKGIFGKVDIITCAAPNLREAPSNRYNSYGRAIDKVDIDDDKLFDLHVKRALAIINVAKENKIDILILGAFGCGAFRNNPYVVAEAYHKVLEQEAINFKEIEFAVYCRSFEDENYQAFKSYFKERK